jgi:hypothetical protein
VHDDENLLLELVGLEDAPEPVIKQDQELVRSTALKERSRSRRG